MHTAGAGYGLFKPILKQVSVRQIGKSVMISEMDDAFFGPPAGAANRNFPQRTLHSGHQPLQVVFHYIVVHSGPHGRDGRIFSNGPRSEDEGNFRVMFADLRQRRRSTEAGQREIAKDDIPTALR